MAARVLTPPRDRRGRFIRAADLPPPRPDPVLHPSDDHPRWRLRVFDLKWPWRASRREAFADAVASGNGSRDEWGTAFLTSPAQIQRDPPFAVDRWRLAERRAARGG